MQNPTPMTLGNMRANDVQTLAVHSGGRWCSHAAVLDVAAHPDEILVPVFGPHIICTVCGAIGADVRPNWQERDRQLVG